MSIPFYFMAYDVSRPFTFNPLSCFSHVSDFSHYILARLVQKN